MKIYPNWKIILLNFLIILAYSNQSTKSMDASSRSRESAPENPIVKVSTISSITEVEKVVQGIHKNHPTDLILVVFDWDRTLSAIEGCQLPLREGKITENVLNSLSAYNAYPIILTSRSYNLSIEGTKNALIKAAMERLEELHGLLPMIKAQCTPESIVITIQGIKHHISYCNGFISASATRDGIAKGIPSIKGYALQELIDQNIIGKLKLKTYEKDIHIFKHIVFIDNDKKHIKNVEEVFSKHNRENIYALYYPIAPENEESSEDMNHCIKTG